MLKIFNKYYPIRNLLFCLGETCLIFGGIYAAMWVLYQGGIPEPTLRAPVWARILLITLIIQVCLYYHDLYDFSTAYKPFDLGIRIVQAIGASCLILAALYYLWPYIILEQGIFFFGLFFLLLFLVSWRIIYQYMCQQNLWSENIVLIGDGNLANLISREIKANLDSGYNIAAVFSNPGNSGLAQELGIGRYTDYSQLDSVSEQNSVSKIVVALEERRGKSPIQYLLDCKLKGLQIIEGVTFYEHLSGKILARQAPPSWLIFSEGFRRYKLTLCSKRVADILFASLGLIVSAPLIVIISAAVKWSSPGPAFFKQTRVGQFGRLFQVVKFRTMRDDAEAGTGAVWATEEDPRITGVGRFLRKLRLDEIPQFWNVLRGEMSFVGPRPERPEFVEQLKKRLPYYGERHSVKPGITGWAQINYPYGASEEDALRKLEYDLFYIKNLSIVFDLFIVLKTVKTVLAGEGSR